MKTISKADELQRKLWGMCLIGAPLLSGVSSLLRFGSNTLFGIGLAQTYAFTLMIMAVLGVANLMRDRAPYVAIFGGALAVFGAVGGLNYGTSLLFQAGAANAGVDAATSVTIGSMLEWDLWPALNIPGLIFPFALLLLSVGLFRTKVVPSWVALSLALGAIAFPIGRAAELQIFYLLSDILLLIPFGYMGLQYFTQPNPAYAQTTATTNLQTARK